MATCTGIEPVISCVTGRRLNHSTNRPILADRVGFEPTERNPPLDAFPRHCLKPLDHPSNSYNLLTGTHALSRVMAHISRVACGFPHITRCCQMFGGEYRTRTDYLLVANQSLYPGELIPRIFVIWRKAWDSNPRYPSGYVSFQD